MPDRTPAARRPPKPLAIVFPQYIRATRGASSLGLYQELRSSLYDHWSESWTIVWPRMPRTMLQGRKVIQRSQAKFESSSALRNSELRRCTGRLCPKQLCMRAYSGMAGLWSRRCCSESDRADNPRTADVNIHRRFQCRRTAHHDGDSCLILGIVDAKVFLQRAQSGVGDIGTIENVKDEKEKQSWY